MTVPGSNLLNQALKVIGRQTFQWAAFQSRATNAIGYDVAVFDAPVTITGSVQPVPLNLYEQYGLDFQKRYINIYAPFNIRDIGRDRTGDQITWGGKTYQVLSDTPWHSLDGWNQSLCVEVG